MSTKVLVLNQDYQAITVCSVQRAFVLVYMEKAELVSDLKDRALVSVTTTFQFPSIIRLYSYVNLPFKRVALSRNNIYKRDGHRCAYCGSREQLTLDHVMPKSRGGKDSWQNLVTACMKCNTFKGNRTPEEANMTLRQPPFRPSHIMFLRDFSGKVQDDWKPYLLMN